MCKCFYFSQIGQFIFAIKKFEFMLMYFFRLILIFEIRNFQKIIWRPLRTPCWRFLVCSISVKMKKALCFSTSLWCPKHAWQCETHNVVNASGCSLDNQWQFICVSMHLNCTALKNIYSVEWNMPSCVVVYCVWWSPPSQGGFV